MKPPCARKASLSVLAFTCAPNLQRKHHHRFWRARRTRGQLRTSSLCNMINHVTQLRLHPQLFVTRAWPDPKKSSFVYVDITKSIAEFAPYLYLSVVLVGLVLFNRLVMVPVYAIFAISKTIESSSCKKMSPNRSFTTKIFHTRVRKYGKKPYFAYFGSEICTFTAFFFGEKCHICVADDAFC